MVSSTPKMDFLLRKISNLHLFHPRKFHQPGQTTTTPKRGSLTHQAPSRSETDRNRSPLVFPRSEGWPLHQDPSLHRWRSGSSWEEGGVLLLNNLKRERLAWKDFFFKGDLGLMRDTWGLMIMNHYHYHHHHHHHHHQQQQHHQRRHHKHHHSWSQCWWSNPSCKAFTLSFLQNPLGVPVPVTRQMPSITWNFSAASMKLKGLGVLCSARALRA